MIRRELVRSLSECYYLNALCYGICQGCDNLGEIYPWASSASFLAHVLIYPLKNFVKIAGKY